MGNTLTAEFAKASIVAEQLGKDNITDFLAISFSSPDYIGHSYGPNSIESEDGFLRLDKELGVCSIFWITRLAKANTQFFFLLTMEWPTYPSS